MNMAKPRGVMVLIVLELFIAALGLATGANLLADPSGKGMGLDVIVEQIPLNDFTIIGAWFVSAYGVFPILLVVGFLIGQRWAWIGAFILAIIQLIWVTGQIYWVGTNILQLLIGAIAALTIFFLYRPAVKKYFQKQVTSKGLKA